MSGEEIKEKGHKKTGSWTNIHPFLRLKFLPLLRSLPPMSSNVKIHLSKLSLRGTAASEKLVALSLARHFVGLRFQHLLKSFLNMHSFIAPHRMTFTLPRPAASEKLLDFMDANHFVGLNSLCLSKSLMASIPAFHFKKQ
jgi:hypothetical protein